MVVWYIYTIITLREGELNNISEESKQLHIRLPGGVHKRLRVKCIHDDISMQDYVSQLITTSLDGFSKEENVGKQNEIGNKAKQ